MAAARPLAGKIALVTGSTSGIGAAIARAFARAGAHVILHGLPHEAAAASAARAEFAALGVRSASSTHDLSTSAGALALAAFAADALGAPVDILVNNAGVQHVCRIEDFEASAWDRVLAVNLSAAFHLTRAALPAMRRGGYGRILNVASVHGLVASRDKSAYVAAKHGLVGLTKAVALETAGAGITANALCPGWVLTPLVQAQIERRAALSAAAAAAAAAAAGAGAAAPAALTLDAAREELLAEKQPSKQFVEAAHLGDLAVFLASPAAAQMTGACLPIDGGWLAQ